ncbi:MAG: GNAT family N-acetyltransferase [Mesorhizobium sp.]
MSHTIANTARRPATSIRLEVADRFDFLSGEYRELFDSADVSAFQHPIWLDAFYRVLAPGMGAAAVIVTGRDEAGRLCMVLPLIRRRKSAVTLLEAADLGVSDYVAPVLTPDLVVDDAFQASLRAVLPAHDILRICKVRADHTAIWTRLLGFEPTEADFGSSAASHGPDYKEWRATAMGQSFAKDVDVKTRRFFKKPDAAFRVLTDPQERARAVRAIRDVRKGRFEGDPIQLDPVCDFYTDVAVNGGDYVRLYALEAEGETVGYTYTTVHGKRLNYFLIGCDYERYRRLSPGYIMYDAMMADWAKAGGEVFDFTIGDEPYKASFGTVRTTMHEFVRGNGWYGKLARVAFDARRALNRPKTDTGK